jgi:hypothetical protein
MARRTGARGGGVIKKIWVSAGNFAGNCIAQGGRISVRSQAGHGTTFVIHLPPEQK